MILRSVATMHELDGVISGNLKVQFRGNEDSNFLSLINQEVEMVPVDHVPSVDQLYRLATLREKCPCGGEIEVSYIPATASEIAEWRARHRACFPVDSLS